MPRLLLFFVCLFSLAAAPLDAAVTLTTRAGVHSDFERLVFDWPFNVTYTLERQGETVTLRFSAPASLSLQNFTAARLTRISNFTVTSSDPLVLTARVASDATIRDFRSGKAVVLDLRGPAVPTTPPPPTPAPEPVAAAPAETPPPAPAPVPEPAPAAAPAPEAAPTVAVTAAPEPTMPSALAQEPAPEPQIIAKPAPRDLPAQSAEELGLTDTPQLMASFDPQILVGSVIFQRADYVYILFDRKLTLSLEQLTGSATQKLNLQELELPKASGYRFRLPPQTQLRSGLAGNVWQIFLSRQAKDIPLTTTLQAQPEFALGARLFFPTARASDPILFTDPIVGDTLTLVPLSEAVGFGITRRLADLQILPSAQGLVIKPLYDKLQLRTTTDGVEIGGSGGLRLSPSTDTGKASSIQQQQRRAGKSVFDLAAWRGKENEDFTIRRQKLMQAVIDVPLAERNRARLELARHYFAYGFGHETLAMLSVLSSDVPDMVNNAEFLALRGAAAVQANRPDEGLVDLEKSSLNTQPEVQLWQGAGHAKLRNWKEALAKFDEQEDVLAHYPEPFASRFYVLAIEAALADGKERLAAEWLDRIESQPHSNTIKYALMYLRGVLHSKAGRPELAAELWREVAKSPDRLYKVRAELALTDLGVATKSLTVKQAADRLEGLRFAWRGDDLEVDILQRLGEFYLDAKDYKNGLGMLAEAVKLYPNSALTPTIRQLMAATFHQIFVANQTEGLSPLAALALYQEYHDLMPKGEEAQAVIFNLAENLVAIDLLDQATALLEDQIKLTTDATVKLKLTTRLAAIYLLDRKSEAAIVALDRMAGTDIPAEAQMERTLLRARAVSDQGKYDEALALLQNADGEAAKALKADILNRAKRWGEAAVILETLIGAPPAPGTQITEQKAAWLVSCALAYALADNKAALDRLAIDYGAAMISTSHNSVFRILTRPDSSLQPKDIIAAQAKISEVDLFRGFLDGYRKQP